MSYVDTSDEANIDDYELQWVPSSSLPRSPADDQDIIDLQHDLDQSSQELDDLEEIITSDLAHLRGLVDGTVTAA